MAQFDVFKNENPHTNASFPYLLDVQNDILKSLSTRVVIPLAVNKKIIQGLTKEFIINKKTLYLFTAQMGSIPIIDLQNKVTDLQMHKEEIKSSIDFLISGF